MVLPSHRATTMLASHAPAECNFYAPIFWLVDAGEDWLQSIEKVLTDEGFIVAAIGYSAPLKEAHVSRVSRLFR
jgi:hypothetical protein